VQAEWNVRRDLSLERVELQAQARGFMGGSRRKRVGPGLGWTGL